MPKKIAVILSGCGYLDGSEITEAISTLIALGQHRAEVSCFAPEMAVTTPTNHLTGQPTSSSSPASETRSVRVESARIARGQVADLRKLDPEKFDAVIFPGGFGAALNLSNWATAGAQCQVHAEVERVIRGFYQAHKPIGAICIAPAVIARVLGADHHVTVTIGNDPATAAEIAKTGALHEACAVEDYLTDREHKVITTPAYMYDDARPDQVFTGISRAIKELIEMA